MMEESILLPSSRGSIPGNAAAARRAYIVVGVVAAAVSAATAAYILRQRARGITPHLESVQQLLDRCHEQVHSIESRLSEISASSGSRSVA